jgi:gamma-glutamyl:cysteine ligase YbdK (ATP-grasp superfamily)
VRGHTPLLPVLDTEDPGAALAGGSAPHLRELRLHQGTVWRWNRAIYDPAGGGHLRVEMRALPAGPTVTDMVANTAFLVGLALDSAPAADAWRTEVDFETVHADFYRAAREGLDAQISWPLELGGTGHAMRAQELVPRLLERAERGLTRAGVDGGEVSEALSVIERRVGTGQTGSVWQRRVLSNAEATRSRDEAISWMFHRYLDHSRSADPVDRWQCPA